MEVIGQLHVSVRVHPEKGALSIQRNPYLFGRKVDVYIAEKRIISAPPPTENLTRSTQPSH